MRKLLLSVLSATACFAQTAAFPSSIADNNQLKVAGNRVQSTLTVSVSSSDTAIVLNSGSGWLPGMLASIGSEVISICGVGGNVLLVGASSASCPNVNGRGYDRTTAAAHLAAACSATVTTGCVSNYVAGWYHNSVAVELEAVEAALGAGLSNVQTAIAAGNYLQYYRGDKQWATLNTAAVPEVSNLYYTDARAQAAISVSGQLTYSGGVLGLATMETEISSGLNSQYWRGDKSWHVLDTTAVAENTNLYYTDTRARAAVSGSSPISYDSATGIISCPTCGSGGGGGSFAGVTAGTNSYALVMGSGGSLTRSGGTIDASSWGGAAISSPTVADQMPMTTSTTAAVWLTWPDCPDSAKHINFTHAGGITCGTTGGSAGSVAFSGLTGSSNTSAAMVVGSGASLSTAGTGTIIATGLASGSSFTGTLSGVNLTLSGVLTVPNSYATVQCLHANGAGVVSVTGAGDCGSGGGGGGVGSATDGQILYDDAGVVNGFTAAGDLTFSRPNFTLNTVNSSVGSCGDATHVGVPTFNGKGLATSCTPVAITGVSGAALLAGANVFTNTNAFQTDTSFYTYAKFYQGLYGGIGALIGVTGANQLDFLNSSSVMRVRMTDTGSGPGGGSSAGLIVPSLYAQPTNANSPAAVIVGASGQAADILDVTSLGMSSKYFRVTAAGLVGIGNYTPSYMLDVNTGSVGGVAMRLGNSVGALLFTPGDGTNSYINSSSWGLGIQTNGITRILTTVNGAVSILNTSANYVPFTVNGNVSAGSADIMDAYAVYGGYKVFALGSNQLTLNGYLAETIMATTQNDSTAISKLACVGSSICMAGSTIGSGATLSSMYIEVFPSSAPTIAIQASGSAYSGVTGFSACTHFVGGVCVSF